LQQSFYDGLGFSAAAMGEASQREVRAGLEQCLPRCVLIAGTIAKNE